MNRAFFPLKRSRCSCLDLEVSPATSSQTPKDPASTYAEHSANAARQSLGTCHPSTARVKVSQDDKWLSISLPLLTMGSIVVTTEAQAHSGSPSDLRDDHIKLDNQQ